MNDNDNNIMTDKAYDDHKEVLLIVHVQPSCFLVYDKENNHLNPLCNKDVEMKSKDGEIEVAKRTRSRSFHQGHSWEVTG